MAMKAKKMKLLMLIIIVNSMRKFMGFTGFGTSLLIYLYFLQKAFFHIKRLFQKQTGGKPVVDLWSFRTFYQDIMDDPTQNKWRTLKEKEKQEN